MKALRTVLSMEMGDWAHRGEWMEDHYTTDMTYAVIAVCEDGRYVHENAFLNDPDGAEALRQRVAERGVIDLAHWGFHEFWSATLEERFDAEAYHENLHRNNMGHYSNGVYSGGHA